MFARSQKTKREVGQALVELAVFGAFFLLIVSAMISYGLRYNFQQRGQQVAFRRAMAIASGTGSDGVIRGSGSYSLSQEQYIPDVSETFGIGSATPIGASAQVTRDYMMHAQAVDAEGLSTPMDIQKSRVMGSAARYDRRNFMSAAFRWERGVSEENVKKYKVVYGGSSIIGDSGDIKVIDPCSGEMPDYEKCFQQARMLVDVSYCTQRCDLNKVPGSQQDCSSDCSKVTNPPNQNNRGYNSGIGGAWYAADYVTNGCTGPYICGSDGYGNPIWCPGSCSSYVFPHLNALFNFASVPGDKKMGIQQDLAVESIRDESLNKLETTAATSTREVVSWSDTLDKTLIRQDNIGAGGFERVWPTAGQYPLQRVAEPMPSVVSGSSDQTWDTAK